MIWLLNGSTQYATILILTTLTSYGHRELIWTAEAQIQPFQLQLHPPMALATGHLAVRGMSSLARIDRDELTTMYGPRWSGHFRHLNIVINRILFVQCHYVLCESVFDSGLLCFVCFLVYVFLFLFAKIDFLCSSRSFYNYESQPKARPEYRYKAKLIQGVWGGWRHPIWAILGRWSPELGGGRLKKGLGTPGVFWEKNWGKPDPQDFVKNGGSGWGILFVKWGVKTVCFK